LVIVVGATSKRLPTRNMGHHRSNVDEVRRSAGLELRGSGIRIN
jgi:hypothetical protein